jgi:hypothetical protein
LPLPTFSKNIQMTLPPWRITTEPKSQTKEENLCPIPLGAVCMALKGGGPTVAVRREGFRAGIKSGGHPLGKAWRTCGAW